MRSHLLRPLFVILAIVVALVVVRQLYVPHDFGVQGRGYTYSWYRASSVTDWKQATVRFQGRDYCRPCHAANFTSLNGTPHALIQCEDCHGPALGHPAKLEKLPIDRSRSLCVRCHAKLPYPSSARGELRGIDPSTHNPGYQCVRCHLPHNPENLRFLQSEANFHPHGNAYCSKCHQAEFEKLTGMPHAVIKCEACHGAAQRHPSDPPKLTIDRTRGLCLSCHDQRDHNVGRACVTCHDPHRSSLQFLRFQA